ncbi:hypothetical protein OsI_30036 [Oryza sativa Indica Group]|uniref:Uncharacterized protein n=1 Tax=Oryza sativa subsp. indica TaxID=39946 RepID=B8B942_ORYSI|nr:hypothetical protein OsI_30036 [Oryza sativa Indica Group]
MAGGFLSMANPAVTLSGVAGRQDMVDRYDRCAFLTGPVKEKMIQC